MFLERKLFDELFQFIDTYRYDKAVCHCDTIGGSNLCIYFTHGADSKNNPDQHLR